MGRRIGIVGLRRGRVGTFVDEKFVVAVTLMGKTSIR
jgi:hypothetical protein